MLRRAALLAAALLAAALLAAAPAAGDPPATVEGIVAVVGEVPILVSDLRLAEAVRLVPPDADLARWGEALLEARIRLELEYQDLTAGGASGPRVDASAALRRLLDAGGGREVLLARLEPYGLGIGDLEELALRIAAVEEAIHLRFGATAPTTATLRELYERELVPEVERRGGTPPPFDAVRDRLRRLAAERELNRRLEAWIAAAEERFPVVRYRSWSAEPGLAAVP